MDKEEKENGFFVGERNANEISGSGFNLADLPKTISHCTNLVCLSYSVPSTLSTLYSSRLQSHKVRAPCMGQSRIAHICLNHIISGGVLF